MLVAMQSTVVFITTKDWIESLSNVHVSEKSRRIVKWKWKKNGNHVYSYEFS